MEIKTVGEFKSNFSQLFNKVIAGEEIGISYCKIKEVVARLVPENTPIKLKENWYCEW